MKIYRLSCALARQRGAIGAFYPITADFSAYSEPEARALYSASYEPAGPSIILQAILVPRGDQRTPIVDTWRDARGRLFQVNDRVVSGTLYPGREGQIVAIDSMHTARVRCVLPLGELIETWPLSDLRLVTARSADDVPCYTF
jgi:hypothetical protein